MSNFDLIIFDCDGTLVDSELLCNIASSEVLVGAGYPQYTPEYCLKHFMGAGQAAVWQAVINDTGAVLPPDVNQRFIERVAANMNLASATPGIEDVLAALSRSYKICVGSNGERPNVVGALEATGLLPFFSDNRIFTVEDVINPKPAPDLYLHAAVQMGVPPNRCLVVEDSITGATAGVAAGMTVFGYTGLTHDSDIHSTHLKSLGVHKTSADIGDLLAFAGI